MSLKDLFGKTSEKVVTNQEIQNLYNQAESEGFLEESIKDKERFLPYVNFESVSNFARYGSAEKYYSDAIKNIYQRYPYDGSKKEKLEWRNNSSQFDLYVFDKLYPKTSGYVNLGGGTESSITTGSIAYRYSSTPQYISVKGGPNAGEDNKFDTGNKYDLTKNRESNLGITELGNTVEFWFKDNVDVTSSITDYQYCYFDLWNGVISGSENYTRLTLERNNSNQFLVTYVSGTVGIVKNAIDYSIDKNNWHHYAFVINNNSSDLNVTLYVDGRYITKNTINNAGVVQLANNADAQAAIGSYITNPSGTEATSWKGIGAAFGSFDEFRFWKEARSAQQIYRNFSMNVGGGSNTDDSNTELGIYFKFNEGIINTEEVNVLDSIVLDYSGRISNGTVNNYSLNVRNTGSAIDAFFNETREAKDPIIYSSNPLVSAVLEEYTVSGSYYDINNNSNIYNSLPAWITEEAESKGLNDLSNLIQIISSYFDTLHIQIENLTKIKDPVYVKKDEKPKPFIKNILGSYGFENIDIFNDVTFLEEVLSRNEEKEFDNKIDEIKNVIYQNIYNNLSYIYKSKGTEKSLRNLIRCFGVDDELVKINLYSNNSEYEINDTYQYVSTPKKFVDFNSLDKYSSTIFQKNKSSDNKTLGYIPFTNKLNNFNVSYNYEIPITIQAEVIFPKKVSSDFTNYNLPDFTNVSLFGVHTAKIDDSDLTWDNEKFVFSISAIKRNNESNDVYFKLSASFDGYPLELTTDWYNDVYDNNKWNFALRISHEKLFNAYTSKDTNLGDYKVEFIGFNSLLDTDVNIPFNLSATIPKNKMEIALLTNKRLFAGAHLQNFTGSVLDKTDVKVSSVRFWFDYLTNEEIKNHSYDSSNYGRKNITWTPNYLKNSAYESPSDATGAYNTITRADTLALHWDFSNVSSSDNNGQFVIEDLTSGTIEPNTDYAYDWFAKLTKRQFTGLGYNFPVNNSNVVNKEYLYSAKLQNFENLNGSDLIRTPDIDRVVRTKNTSPVTFYIAIEKSMSQVINNEILNWFATIKDFNNLIGEPIERYKEQYSGLKHLRNIFFSRINNEPDFEKFLTFYKWIDSSISMMIQQLIPASANVTDKVRNLVESHLLERNKYQNKLPTLEFKGEIIDIVASNGIQFSYPTQNTPSSPAGTLWLKQRINRTTEGLIGNEYVNTPLEPQNDIDREIIRQVINYSGASKTPIFYSVNNNQYYEGKKDSVKIFNKPYAISGNQLLAIDSIVSLGVISNRKYSSLNIGNTEQSSSISNLFINNKLKTNNYKKNYEFVQLSSRRTNNKSFIDAEGNISGSYNNSGLGFYDRALLSRSVNESIFVERFSAPGGPEVNSRGALDQESEEYSVYNSSNYRNYKVRKQLASWLAESASIDSENPSYHQVNKNAFRYPSSITGTSIKTQYDNAFVSHAIPRSDNQYRWISASNQNTSSLSFYTNDPESGIFPTYNSGVIYNIDYDIVETPITPYTMSAVVTSSRNYSGSLADSGGTSSNYSPNEQYSFILLPTASNSTYDTAWSISYELSSSVSTSLSGNAYSKLRAYFADDPALLESGSYVFPDIWYPATVISGTTTISESPFYVSGCLNALKINNPILFPYAVEDPTTVHGMDISGSTIFVVGNFTQIISSVSGVLPVSGAFAYNYETKTYYDFFSGSYPGPYGSPHTESWWIPYAVFYTRFNEHDYLIFSHGARNYSNVNEVYNGNNGSISIYNLTIKKWNSFANAKVDNNPYTYTDAGLKNISGDTEFTTYFLQGATTRFFTFDNLTESNGNIGVLNSLLRDIDGNKIYPESSTSGRNNFRNINYFSIDPASPLFCSGHLYVNLSMNAQDGFTTDREVFHTFVSSSNGYDLYVAGQGLSGNNDPEISSWTMIKINSDGSKAPVRLDPYYRTIRVGGVNGTLYSYVQPSKIIANGSKIWMYSDLSQKAGTTFYDDKISVSSYDTITQNFTHVTGGFDAPIQGERNISRFYPSSGFFFSVGNYVYVVGKYQSNINTNNPKYLSTSLDKQTLLRYNTKYDTDDYFAPVVGNKEPLAKYWTNTTEENILFIGNINVGKNLPFSNPNHGKIFAPQPTFFNEIGTKLQFNFFNASKYNEVTLPSKTFGNAITSSLEYTGSNLLVTWTSNDVTASGFELIWNKEKPILINRIDYGNYLGLRSNALPDYYFTNPLIMADTDTNTISFNNISSFTFPYSLNSYLLNINGPYQYASWQQLRNANNPLLVASRKNNEIVIQDKPIIENKFDENGRAVSFIRNRAETFTKYKEPAVTFNKPMLHTVAVSGSNIPVEFISTYDNNKQKFVNEDLVQRLNVGEKSDPQTHDLLILLENGLYEPKPEILNASYQQYLYPRSELATSKEIVTKPNYAEIAGTSSNGYDRSFANIRTFWKDDILERARSLTNRHNSINLDNYSIIDYYITYIPLINLPVVNSIPVSSIKRTNMYRNYSGSLLTLIKSLDNNYDTVWALDNSSSIEYTFENYHPSSTGSLSSKLGTNKININSSYVSELNKGDDYFELVEALKLPSGSYIYKNQKIGGDNYELVEFYNYLSFGGIFGILLPLPAFKGFTYIPSPLYSYKLHIPATTYVDERVQGQFIDYKEAYSYRFINDGFIYATAKLAGKNPWHNSYEEFRKDIAPNSVNYSVVPEYKISDHMDFYIKENSGDFKKLLTGSYLSLDGASVNFSDIEEKYNSTNIIKTNIYDDVEKGDQVLNITINGIKKLLPYKGFYPSDRTTQIVGLFQKCFFGFENIKDFLFSQYTNLAFNSANTQIDTRHATSNHSGYLGNRSSGTPILQQIQTVMQPLFAPGILYNTIKAGIAVDWPVILENKFDLPYNVDGGIAPFYSYKRSDLGDLPVENRQYVVGKEPDHRLPFEALLDFKKGFNEELISNKVLYYLDPSRLSVDVISGSDRELIRTPSYDLSNDYRFNKSSDYIDDRYKLAINNFLAEIPNFFLSDGKLTSFISKPGPYTLAPNKRYEMTLKLYKDDNLKMFISNTDVSSSIKYVFNYQSKSIFIPEASAYGPPYLYTNFIPRQVDEFSKFFEIGNAFQLYKDPAYAPYAPSYYFGEKILKIYLDVTQSSDTDTGREWTLQEILNNLKYEDVSIGIDNAFASASNRIKYNVDYVDSPAYKGRMPLTASIIINGITNVKDVEYDENGLPTNILNDKPAWVIQTKYETPVLNFNNEININELSSNTFITNSVNKTIRTDFLDDSVTTSSYTSSHYYADVRTGFIGMWSGYGELPNNKENIYLSLEGPSKTTFVTQSLIDAVGFTPANKKIGQLASSKQISEAIILIPYTQNYKNHDGSGKYAKTINEILGENNVYNEKDFGTGPFYFSLDPLLINNLLEIPFSDSKTTVQTIKNALKSKSSDTYVPKTSVYRTIKAMTEYNIPPHLDWVTNRNINPFVMYIIEFKHTLDKQDLSDIWQGVMPKIAMNAEKETVTFSHNLNVNEFFEGKKIPPDVRWKVFKVKKKANNNYYDLTANSADDDRFKFTFKNDPTIPLEYSYNWPYDNFSLVELVNIEAKLDAGYNVISETKVNVPAEQTTRAAISDVANTKINSRLLQSGAKEEIGKNIPNIAGFFGKK